ncbi:hypothetical protein FXF51_02495 [Nonomuraea sp. PA05]|uniref:hypothetical protein n=1 Tax=Nonomuraea sp. PA05 TaxID=2604466 RepID=UPI0011D8227C|nr:hypothetical protein [Nonomuraea sp. PA05]TYB71317.1 hypothetical protein FXF51_02495 [Nonomuraea sp. PA05]
MTNVHHGGVRLQEPAGTLGSPLVELLAAPAGADVLIRRVVVVEPGDPTEAGDLALLVGVRGAAAVPASPAENDHLSPLSRQDNGTRHAMSDRTMPGQGTATYPCPTMHPITDFMAGHP